MSIGELGAGRWLRGSMMGGLNVMLNEFLKFRIPGPKNLRKLYYAGNDAVEEEFNWR